MTNGGKNRGRLQMCFRWTLGKKNFEDQKVHGNVPVLQKTKVTLKGLK